ncbi:MAG: peptidyl-prolyl cis-trans isomerase [Candidatus Omnitrophica bacterium]|nr:peptidyl-prolyl cis-trans isomerase [Candidatus Omnitrophota bacterium]
MRGKFPKRVGGQHGVLNAFHWAYSVALPLTIGLMAVGCERMPWNQPSGSTGSDSLVTSQTSTAVPSRPVVPPSEIIATINQATISKKDIELAIQELRATAETLDQKWEPLPETDDPNRYDLHDVVNDLIVAELRTQDATARGIDRESEVQQLFWYRYRTFFGQEWVRSQLGRMNVTQEEVEEFYRTNQQGFREPEQIKVRQLAVSSEEQAKAALVKLLEGVDFASVAQQVSLHPEEAQGPLTKQWAMRSAEKAIFAPSDESIRDLKDQVLEQAAFAIDKVGGVSHYVKGADGNYHIFQLAERKPGRQRPLVEVSDNIKQFLQLQKLVDQTDELRSKAKIEQFPERVKGIPQ